MADAPHKMSHSTAGAEKEELGEHRTLRDYMIILRERLWIALPLAAIAALVYGYSQARQVKMYAAHATMQFEKPDTVFVTKGVVDQSINSDADINTNIQILQSNRLQAKVVASFTPDEMRILQRAALKRLSPGSPASAIGIPLGTVEF